MIKWLLAVKDATNAKMMAVQPIVIALALGCVTSYV